MRIIFYVLTTLVAALVTWGFSLLILRLSHRFRLYPKIRSRDVHTQPTPRLGGVAMFLGLLAAVGVAWLVPALRPAFRDSTQILTILLAALIIVVMGVIDDIWDLDWLTKLAGQIIAAVVLAFGGTQILSLPIGGIVVPSAFLSLLLTVFAVVLVMNAVNFVDGLDGLVAGVAIIANGTFFIYTYLQQSHDNLAYYNLAALITAVLIGICLGFLPVNFHPAKMFMGDAGALLVGLLMAVSAINVTGLIDPGQIITGGSIGHKVVLVAFIPILLPFAILIIPLLDFGLAVIRRLRAGKSPFSADRKHLHHRLLDMGHTHLHAVLIFYSWTAVASIGLLSVLFVPWFWSLVFLVVGLVVTSAFTLAPLSKRKRAEARAQLTEVSGSAGSRDVARLDPLDAGAVIEPGAEGLDR